MAISNLRSQGSIESAMDDQVATVVIAQFTFAPVQLKQPSLRPRGDIRKILLQ